MSRLSRIGYFPYIPVILNWTSRSLETEFIESLVVEHIIERKVADTNSDEWQT